MMSKRLPELLAPAGSPEALDAAIEAGADAVYFGAGDYNARMRAKNFTDEELFDALSKCAGYGVKSYITVNTRLKDSELDDVVMLAEKLYLGGATALIVADLGAASLIKSRIPSFEIHASTQLSGHSAEDAKVLSSLGFSRMVCPREMTYEEIKTLCGKSPIEIEMFIHGAHCVSFSGQCLMSFAMGGRSGNRGMCAQPCRLPFSIDGVKNDHPLSLKDMCLAGNIGRIIESGVSSLKIEGRQKSADYVYGVTSVYRRLLDERRDATAQEIARLSEIFDRGGLTDGYLNGSYGAMLGMRREDEKTAPTGFSGLERKIPLDAELTVKVGERPKLVFTSGSRAAVSEGGVTASRTTGEPMSYEAAKEKTGRLGNTPFVLRSFSAQIDENAYFSLSELNSLRRAAVNKLSGHEERSEKDFSNNEKRTFHRTENNPKQLITAEFERVSQIPEEAFTYFDKIYVPFAELSYADGEKVCVRTEPLTYDGSYDELKAALSNVKGEVMVHGFGQAAVVRECGAVPVGSFRFNVMNSRCADEVLKYVDAVTISPEAPSALCRDVAGETSMIVYGRLPLMHAERCMMSDGGAACPFGGAGGRCHPERKKKKGSHGEKSCDGRRCTSFMTDRTGTKFPIIGLSDCSNVIYNSVPIYMADRKDFLRKTYANRLHFIFTVESREECAKVIKAYKDGVPSESGAVRRIR